MKVWRLNDIKTLNLLSNTDSESENYEPIIPDEEHIKVKVTRTCITSSDLSAYLGKYKFYPIVPCRSAVALISESDIPAYKKGQRVYLTPYHTCTNNSNFKIHGVNIDGYLGDYVLTPTRSVFDLPEGVKEDSAIFIEDIALAINTLEKIEIQKGDYIMLYGASAINCIIAELAIYYQAIPIIVDKDEERIKIAQHLGIYYSINTLDEILHNKIKEITAGKMVNHLIFDTDSFSSLDQFTELVKPYGTICLVGYNKYPHDINCNLQNIVANGLNIKCVSNGFSYIPSAINMLANDIIHTQSLIEQTIDFNDIVSTFAELSDKRNFFKTLVKC